MKILILAASEPGSLNNGPAIIFTNTLVALSQMPGVEVRIGLLKETDSLPAVAAASNDRYSATFAICRASHVRSTMLRAAIGGPLLSAERAFLRHCERESRNCDVAIWLGSSWDPVSLYLPAVCSCPVFHHPTDSVTLAEINRLPSALTPLRVCIARCLERRILTSGYAGVIYNSPKDASYAASLISIPERDRIVLMPIGVDCNAFYPTREKATRERVRVVFSGVMNYRPNADAAVALVKEVLPHVTAGVEIRIVGRDPLPSVTALQSYDPRVVVTGAVSNVAEELRNADIFVAPMVSGGGISNKVLEAMACGLPVIVTPLVAENFTDRPSLMQVASSSRDIARAIDFLAKDRHVRARLGTEAAQYIRTGNWSWQSRADRLVQLFARQ